MPEGHVVHRQARQLRRAFGGDAVRVDSPQGRFSSGARRVDRRTLVGTDAVGKHLLLAFDNDLSIHVHLGLYGKWRLGRGSVPDPQGEIRLRLRTPGHWAELRGPTACEVLDADQVATLVARIGPDPLRRDADPERAWRKVSRSGTSIAVLLMDQAVFAGVGNIYRAEVLFRAGLAPTTPGRSVTRAQFDALWEDLVVLMADGVRRERIDTVRDEHSPQVTGREPRRDRHGGEVYVYRRAGMPCLVCDRTVRHEELQGRHLYWCASCQRRR